MSNLLRRLEKIEKELEGMDKDYIFEVVFSKDEEELLIDRHKDDVNAHLIILKLYD